LGRPRLVSGICQTRLTIRRPMPPTTAMVPTVMPMTPEMTVSRGPGDSPGTGFLGRKYDQGVRACPARERVP
jgi:hypothetical protein